MIRVYYKPETGAITYTVDVEFATPGIEHYIDVENMFKLDEYKVNTETMTLERTVPETFGFTRIR